MTLNQKNKLIKKYGSKLINDVFLYFMKGKDIDACCYKFELAPRVVEDLLRVSFYTLDAIIVDQRDEIEGMEVLTSSALAALPDKKRKALIERAKDKK